VVSVKQPDPIEPTVRRLAGCDVEIIEAGSGRPLLFLHPMIGLRSAAPALAALAAQGRIIAPSHPGFGRSERPADFDSVDDLAFFYLDLMAELDLREAVLIGCDIGGWIAAEIAVRSTERIAALVLAGATGIRVGDRDMQDLADIFALPKAEVDRLSFHDPVHAALDIAAMSEAEVTALARNREATALYGWSPYLHHPKLRGRLRRAAVPALVLWGEQDGIAPVAYGRAYAQALPNARFETIAACGHYPHIEQPDIFAARIATFLDGAGLSDRSIATPKQRSAV